MGKGKKLNIYTDSRYAFATAHIHRAVYQERGLLTAEGKTIKNKQETLDLLQALRGHKVGNNTLPQHQKGSGTIPLGNNLGGKTAKEVASVPGAMVTLTDPGARGLPQIPKSIPEDLA